MKEMKLPQAITDQILRDSHTDRIKGTKNA